jgi:hypothetical protein
VYVCACARVRVHACVRVRVRVRLRACACVRVRVCARTHTQHAARELVRPAGPEPAFSMRRFAADSDRDQTPLAPGPRVPLRLRHTRGPARPPICRMLVCLSVCRIVRSVGRPVSQSVGLCACQARAAWMPCCLSSGLSLLQTVSARLSVCPCPSARHAAPAFAARRRTEAKPKAGSCFTTKFDHYGGPQFLPSAFD